MVLAARMLLTPAAFARRVVHRATVALSLWLAALMLATLLAIHGRTAEALATMSRPLIRSAVSSIGGIHGAGAAILWRIHRSTLPIALGLCVTLGRSAITRTRPLQAALRFTQGIRTGTIPFTLFSRTRQVTRCRSRRSIHFGRCGRKWRSGGRLICRLGILGLQWSDAERESTAKPGESVGFGFHVGVLVGLTAGGETLVETKSCDPPVQPR